MACKSIEINLIAPTGSNPEFPAPSPPGLPPDASPGSSPITPIPDSEQPSNASAMGADLSNEPEPGETGDVFPPNNQPITGVNGDVIGVENGEAAPPQIAFNTDIITDSTLGSLSSTYESNGDPTIIGRDNTGGFSYGEYQIATKTGTFGIYMDYLQENNITLYNQLQAVGGETAATIGDLAFKTQWKSLMANPANAQTQHDFIQATHYNPTVDNINNYVGLNIQTHDKAMQDVIWSTAVQHGPNSTTTIVQRAINNSGRPVDQITDAELIEEIYNERGKDMGRKYFKKSTPTVRSSVVARFQSEKADALTALG